MVRCIKLLLVFACCADISGAVVLQAQKKRDLLGASCWEVVAQCLAVCGGFCNTHVASLPS